MENPAVHLEKGVLSGEIYAISSSCVTWGHYDDRR